MKKLSKKLIASVLLSASAESFAGVSANVGAMSDYWFRGLDQSGENGHASMMGGLDYESDMGFYAGTWLASLPSDLEYDLYGGYNGSYEDFSYGVGVIVYLYDKCEGGYFEAGYSMTYEGLEMSVAAIFPDDDNSANAWVSDTDQLTFTNGKSFDLF